MSKVPDHKLNDQQVADIKSTYEFRVLIETSNIPLHVELWLMQSICRKLKCDVWQVNSVLKQETGDGSESN